MKCNNIYRMAKVERCVDCLVKDVIEIQLHPMNFNRDGRFMLSRTRQLLLQQVWNTSGENWDQRAVFHPFPTAKNSYYLKHSNYQDCLHSATVYWGEIQWPDLCNHICWQFLKCGISNLMLIWVSYSVNNHHVGAVVLQEASLKMWPNALYFIMYNGESLKSVWVRMSYSVMRTL